MNQAIRTIKTNLHAFGQRLWASTCRAKTKASKAVQESLTRVKVYMHR